MAKEFVKGLRGCNSEDGLLGLLRDYNRYLDAQAITALGSYLAIAASGKIEFVSSRSSLISYARTEWVPLFMGNIHQMDHVGLSICIHSMVKISSLDPSRAFLDEDDVRRLWRSVDENMHLCSPRSAVETLSGLWGLGSGAGLSSPLPLPWVTRFLACSLPNTSLVLSSPQDLAVLLRCLAKIHQHQIWTSKAQRLHERQQGYHSASPNTDGPRYPYSKRWALNLMAVLGKKAAYMNLREIGTVSWSVAVLGIDPGSNILNALWKQAEALLLQPDRSFSAASLGGLCYSLCITSHPPPLRLLNAIKLAVLPSVPSNRSLMDMMNARDLMLLLMALGRWRSQEVDLLHLRRAISESLTRTCILSTCSASSIAGVLHALSQLSINPPMEVMHQVEKRLSFLLKQGTCSAVATARILTAFGAHGYAPCSSLGSYLVLQMVDQMDHIAAKRFFPAALAIVKLRLPITEAQMTALACGPHHCGKYGYVVGMRNFIQHAQVMAVAQKLLGRRSSSDWQGKLISSAEGLIRAASSQQDESGGDLIMIRDLLSFINDNLNPIFINKH